MKTWATVNRLIRFRPGLFLSSVVLWTLIFGLPLWTGLLIKQLFDALSDSASIENGVWGLIALLVVSMIARIGVLIGGFYVDFTFTFTVASLLRKNILERILRRPGAQALPDTVGEAISRFRDDVGEIAGFVSWIADLVYKPVLAVLALIIMLQINAKLTLVVLLPLVALLFTVNLVKQHLETYRKASREATGRVTGYIGELFQSVQVIKVAGAEHRAVDHLQTLNETRRQTAVRDRMLSDLLNTLFDNFINLGTGLILLVGATSMQTGSFTVGDYALFVFYLAWLANITNFLGRLIAFFKQAGVSIDRVEALAAHDAVGLAKHGDVHLDGTLPDVPYTQKTEADRLDTLEAKGLTYHYPDTGRGIDNINLTLKRGQLTVITGRIGSGKTTVLRTLLGLLPAEQGDIHWNGNRVEHPANFFTPPRTAYAAQVPQLFAETLRDNILMGLPERQVNMQEALHRAVLHQDVQTMEQGIDTLVGTKGVRLSGGQVQRAAAARMFIREAELLILDDISSALDIEIERTLWERLTTQKDTTILAVSHKPSVLQQADHIILLNNGRIEAQGSLHQLLTTSEEIRQIMNTS